MRVLMWEHFAPGGPIRVGGHHLSERFIRDGAEVAWCVGPISPINFVKMNRETRARLRLWWRGGERSAAGAMFAYGPMTLAPYRPYPLFDSRAMHRLTLRATIPRWTRVLARAGFDRVDLLWMTPGSPMLALLDAIPHGRSIYRMSDDTPEFPDTPKSYATIERETARRVDLVVATAGCLAERARRLGARRVLHLPNACDPARFTAGPFPEPADLARYPRPRAIYAGAIDSWFDAALLAETAALRPDWTFVLLGPVRADLRRLQNRPNIALLGARAYADLPAYLGASDAGLVPFRKGPLTEAIHPIKVYEYCAAGLPVVSVPLRETAATGAPILFAGDAAAFGAALDRARVEGASGRRERVAFAEANSWDARYAKLKEMLATIAEPGDPLAGSMRRLA